MGFRIAKNRFIQVVTCAAALMSTGAISLERHEAGSAKTGRYVTEGYFTGGHKDVTSARLKDIRRGPQGAGAERIVFDLEGAAGSTDAVPFFQINVNPGERRLLLSIWADVTYEFDQDRVARAFARSSHVRAVKVMPRVEDGVATVELTLHGKTRGGVKVEAFSLSSPARIILDLI